MVVVAAAVGVGGGGVETATAVPVKSFLPVTATLAAFTTKLDASRLALVVETLFVMFELIDDEDDNDEEEVDDDDGIDDVVVLNFNTL